MATYPLQALLIILFFQVGERVRVILDCDDNTLSFEKNYEFLGVAFRGKISFMIATVDTSLVTKLLLYAINIAILVFAMFVPFYFLLQIPAVIKSLTLQTFGHVWSSCFSKVLQSQNKCLWDWTTQQCWIVVTKTNIS